MMQHNKLNISMNQLILEALSMYGHGSVKGAHQAGFCGEAGIYLPLTGSDHTLHLLLRQLICDRIIVNNFLILCLLN